MFKNHPSICEVPIHFYFRYHGLFWTVLNSTGHETLRCNFEDISDLCFVDTPQMVTTFNLLWSYFFTVDKFRYITEYY